MALDLKELLSSYSYEPKTGVFKRIKRKNRWGYFVVNEIAGTKSHGYITIGVQNNVIFAHRLAFLFMTGRLPKRGTDVDHINKIKDDNRWENLRLATRGQNNINSGKPKNNTTGFKGVHFIKDKRKKRLNPWFARIKVKGKIIHLGVFSSKNDAIEVRKEAEKKYYGEFSPHKTGGSNES
jgi:hypothetical protein